MSNSTREMTSKLAGVLAIWAISLPTCGLLSLTRFDQSVLIIARMTTLTLVFLAASVMSSQIVGGDLGGDSWKFLGIVMILAALGIVCLPVLHKVAGMPPASETVASDLSITLICPRCSLSQSLRSGASRCERCRLKFVIEVEEPRCRTCRYLLYQLTEPRCPECGTPVDIGDIITPANAPAV